MITTPSLFARPRTDVTPSVSLIIPAFNEAERIATTIKEAVGYFEGRGIDYDIVVAADGDDGSREIALDIAAGNGRISVIGGSGRGGKGRGIRMAVPLTLGEIVGFTDADNKTPIDELDHFLVLLEDDDLVIGSRFLAGARIEQRQPFHRRIGSWGFGVFVHTVLGLRDIPDTQCGFKFFRRPVALDLFGRQSIDGYMFDIEILYLAEKSNYRIGQIPVRWRDDGDSRLQLVRQNIRNVADVIGLARRHRRSTGAH